MAGERSEREVVLPKLFPGIGIQAKDGQSAALVSGGGDEYTMSPKHGRGVAGAGEFDLPTDVCSGRPGGNAFGGADAGAVRSAEAGPILGPRVGRDARQSQGEAGDGKWALHGRGIY